MPNKFQHKGRSSYCVGAALAIRTVRTSYLAPCNGTVDCTQGQLLFDALQPYTLETIAHSYIETSFNLFDRQIMSILSCTG